MRLSKTLDLEDGRAAVVREPTVGMMRNMLENYKSGGVLDLLSGNFASLSLLSQTVEMPEGETLGNLSLSELHEAWGVLKELAPFLEMMESLGRASVQQAATASTPGPST